MTLLLKQLFGFFKLLHSETGNNQLAWGVALGFILGMTPALSLQTLLVFFCLFFFRIQIGAAFLAAFFFKFIAYLLDPVFDVVGQKVLDLPALQGLFTDLYNMPIIPFTRFNNSIVMGSGVVAIILVPFIFAGAKWAIVKYRISVVEKFRETKIFKIWTKTSLYQWYYKYDSYFGN
ncbi:MAG: TIGR03546 family protein [Bacteriovoracaceae bacterium]|nr:TIGR03546 family protein [Bacteriovoracaceae bacterium]